MINTSETYGKKYCKRIDAKKWRHNTIPPAMKVIYDHFKPTSVIDLGCANGLHLKGFKEAGVSRLFGIEGTIHWAPYIKKYFGYDFIISDMRKPLPNIGSKFDLAVSFEVLEHLEESCAKQAASNIAQYSNTLCLTACPSGGGFRHINPQPPEYWINIFTALDFAYCPDEVEQLQEKFVKMRCSEWFKTDLKVFRKFN